MRFYYSDTFNIPLPEKHRFPGQKYGRLRRCLIDEGILSEDQLHESPLATPSDLECAHDLTYIKSFIDGTLDPKALRRIGFPWSPFLVRRTLATVGGAIAASIAALEFGLSGQLAGGTHHAHHDFGSGYCIFNDFAVAALKLLESSTINRIAILDLDVHQGDGNASILKDNPQVFVVSLHGRKNFPFRKWPSDMDFPLDDHCDDETYLKTLSRALGQLDDFQPEFLFYQAGVDVLKTDALGRLDLSMAGLYRRDAMVFEFAKSRSLPLSMGIGGGYGKPIDTTVDGYVQTYRAAKSVYSELPW